MSETERTNPSIQARHYSANKIGNEYYTMNGWNHELHKGSEIRCALNCHVSKHIVDTSILYCTACVILPHHSFVVNPLYISFALYTFYLEISTFITRNFDFIKSKFYFYNSNVLQILKYQVIEISWNFELLFL